MTRIVFAAPLLLVPALLLAPGCGRKPLEEADLVVSGVRLGGGGESGAIAIAAGKVIVAGSPAAVEKHAGKETRRADLGGVSLAPGAREILARPFEAGERLLNEATGGSAWLDLAGSESEEDAVQRVRQVARVVGPGAFILGAGWDETRWIDVHLPDDRLISDIVAYNPVLLVRRGGAIGWANHKALEAVGLGHQHAVVQGDDLIKVLRGAPALTTEERAAAIEAALVAAAARGVVETSARATGGRLGVEDVGASAAVVLEPWRLLAGKGRLPVRVELMLPAPSAAAATLAEHGPELLPGGRLRIGTLLIDAAEGMASDWVVRAARAGLTVALLVRDPDAARAASGLITAARATRPDAPARVIVPAGGDPGADGLAAFVKADVPVAAESAVEAPSLAATADAAWLAPGSPADFLVIGSDPQAGVTLEATWVGGVEVYRRAATSRP